MIRRSGEADRWARASASYMARLYAGAGVDVIIDDVCVPEEFAHHYHDLFQEPAVQRVLLLPKPSALIDRIHRRAGPYDQVLVQLLPFFYGYLEPMSKAGWLVVDSSDWTIDQTVREVLRQLDAKPDTAADQA